MLNIDFISAQHLLVASAELLKRRQCAKSCLRSTRKQGVKTIRSMIDEAWRLLDAKTTRLVKRRMLHCLFWRDTGLENFGEFCDKYFVGIWADLFQKHFLDWQKETLNRTRYKSHYRLTKDFLLQFNPPLSESESVYVLSDISPEAIEDIRLHLHGVMNKGCQRINHLSTSLQLVINSQLQIIVPLTPSSN